MSNLPKLFRFIKKSGLNTQLSKHTKHRKSASHRYAWLLGLLASFVAAPGWAITPTGLNFTINASMDCGTTPGSVDYDTTITFATDDGGGIDYAAVVLVNSSGIILDLNEYSVDSGTGMTDIMGTVSTTEITDTSLILIDTTSVGEYMIGGMAPAAMSPNIIFEQPIGFLCATPDTTAPTVTITAPATATAAYTATFDFSEPVTGFDVTDIVVGNGTAGSFSGSGATYTALITPTAPGTVTIDVNAGAAKDLANNDNTAATQATTTYSTTSSPSQAITVSKTKLAIREYIANLLRMQSRQFNIPLSDVWATYEGTTYYGKDISPTFTARSSTGFSLNGDEQLNRGKFSFNLRQYVNALSQAEAVSKATHNAAATDTSVPTAGNAYQSDYNLWAKAAWSKSEQDRGNTDEHSDYAILRVGVDYRYSKDLFIGVILQLDEADEKSRVLDTRAKGDGWMLGPYVVSKLSDTLIFDAQAAWGRGNNKINPLGSYWDKFDTNRFQVAANLKGRFDYGRWRIIPAVGVLYMTTEQEAYTDSNGFRIDSQEVRLGNLSFGPTFTYNYDTQDGMQIRPSLGLTGIYEFESPDITDVNGLAVGTEDLRAELKLGVDLRTRAGTVFAASYSYDGIGTSDYKSESAELRLIVPVKVQGQQGASFQGAYQFGGASLFDADNAANLKFEFSMPF